MLFGFIALTIVLRVVEPEREHLGPPWLVPAVEIGLLVALLAADPMHLAAPHQVAASARDHADPAC